MAKIGCEFACKATRYCAEECSVSDVALKTVLYQMYTRLASLALKNALCQRHHTEICTVAKRLAPKTEDSQAKVSRETISLEL